MCGFHQQLEQVGRLYAVIGAAGERGRAETGYWHKMPGSRYPFLTKKTIARFLGFYTVFVSVLIRYGTGCFFNPASCNR
jgi:hypothetical protein